MEKNKKSSISEFVESKRFVFFLITSGIGILISSLSIVILSSFKYYASKEIIYLIILFFVLFFLSGLTLILYSSSHDTYYIERLLRKLLKEHKEVQS